MYDLFDNVAGLPVQDVTPCMWGRNNLYYTYSFFTAVR